MATLELEYAAIVAQGDANIKTEMRVRSEEVDRLRVEAGAKAKAWADRYSEQSRELEENVLKVAELGASLISQQLSMQQQCEKDVSSARIAEAQRHEAAARDMKKKLDTFMAFRENLNARCDGYVAELKSAQESHAEALSVTQEQEARLESELVRHQEKYDVLKEAADAMRAQGVVVAGALADSRGKLERLQHSATEWQLALSEAVAEREALRERALSAERSVGDLQESRNKEFMSVMQCITQSVKKEYGTIFF